MAGLALSLAFLSGVILHDSGVGWLISIPLVLAAVTMQFIVKRPADRAVVVLALLCVGLGAWRAQEVTPVTDHIVVPVSSADRTIVAVVSGVPKSASSRTRVSIELQAPSRKTLSASLPSFPSIRYGDIISIWAPPSWNTSDPQEVELPVSHGQNLFVPSFTVIGSKATQLDRLRTSINDVATRSIETYVPEPAGSLTLGVLNGDDSGMTDATRSAFQASGMSQITAVSGWNVAMVAGLLAILLRYLVPSRSLLTLASIVGVWAYAFLVGLEPSVLRAAGMASIFLLAHWRGRPGDLLTSLVMTTALMLAITPLIRFNIGFQLSVAATVGIVLLLEQSYSRPAWQTALAVPLVSEISVAPLLLHHLGTYSISSPLANLVSGPLVPLVMAGGVVTMLLAPIHPILGEIAGAFTWVPARLIVAVAERAAAFRWTSSTTVTLGWTTTLLIYIALLLAYLAWARGHFIRRSDDGVRGSPDAI